VYGKTKDTPEAREDQQCMKDPNNMHPQNKTDKGHHLSPASYGLTKAEKEIFLKSFQVSNAVWLLIKYKGNNKYDREKFQNLKSHDCHVIMTQLLPVALRGF
jgi:hypothetical protein